MLYTLHTYYFLCQITSIIHDKIKIKKGDVQKPQHYLQMKNLYSLQKTLCGEGRADEETKVPKKRKISHLFETFFS